MLNVAFVHGDEERKNFFLFILIAPNLVHFHLVQSAVEEKRQNANNLSNKNVWRGMLWSVSCGVGENLFGCETLRNGH